VPTYQYACTECGHSFDTVQSFSEDSLTVCPECGGKLRKVFNAVGVVFKGSGFYRTDSRGKQTSSEPASSSSSTEGSSKKADSGPSTTSDSGSSSTKSDSGAGTSGSSPKKSESSKS
jgi:putative FmdB family regulatory protein